MGAAVGGGRFKVRDSFICWYSFCPCIMKFPGKRKSKHYFPASSRDPLIKASSEQGESKSNYVSGIDQIMVDIEAKVGDDFIRRYELSAGHSLVIDDSKAEALYKELVEGGLITHQFAGGTIGNTLHNYSVLADDRSVLLGVMCNNIQVGGYAYRYLCNTSSRMDLNYLQGVDGAIGRCFTLIGDSGERTFAISPAQMNQLQASSIPESVVAESPNSRSNTARGCASAGSGVVGDAHDRLFWYTHA